MTQTYEIATLHPVFVRQLDALAGGDVDVLMENYHQDSVLLRFDGVATGFDEVRATLSVYLSLGPELVELSQYAQTDDTISYRAIMKIGGRNEKAFGTLVLRDGKIWRQTVGFGD
jgi:hypothetical protein